MNNAIYNCERFGINFTASPRFADMLLVTGPVSFNMEIALKRTYHAVPHPKIVVAVGDCGCDGGIFGESYASLGESATSSRWMPKYRAAPPGRQTCCAASSR